MFLLAAGENLWEDVIRALAGNGVWVFLSIVTLLWVLEGVVKRFMQHRERMAMIEAGFNPADLERAKKGPSPDGDDEAAADGIRIELRDSA